MAVLRFALASILLVGCYAPDLPDCAVACAKNDDCAGDQVCTDQGRCAADGQTCNAETVDAGPGATADGAIDAPHTIMLKVEIMGEGTVTVTNVGTCTAPGGPMCMWMVTPGRYQITATATRVDKPFDRWTSLLCGGQGATCNADVFVGGSVAAKFH